MKKFAMVFHLDTSINTDDLNSDERFAAWMAWYKAMGGKVVDSGTPVGKSWKVSKEGTHQGVGQYPVSGYSIIQAADYAEACEIASGCPDVSLGVCWVEVAECVDIV